MDVKGQVSVEYLLVILVIIIILGSVSIPLIRTSINSSMDISKTSDVSNAVNSIANAINVVYANGPGAKRTISVYIPVNSALVYDNVSSLTMVVTNVSTTATGGTNKTVTANVNYKNVTITPSALTKKWYTVTIEWPVNNNALGPITVTFS